MKMLGHNYYLLCQLQQNLTFLPISEIYIPKFFKFYIQAKPALTIKLSNLQTLNFPLSHFHPSSPPSKSLSRSLPPFFKFPVTSHNSPVTICCLLFSSPRL